ncbi:MAG: class I SAM-dependent methyltransferase [Clostridiales bacterium]|nr:class I SAM-dependent methyltransferase [Clostridiales bacterium]
MIRFLKMRHAKRVCDAGCGCGIYSLKLSRFGFIVSGFDIAENAVSLTKALISQNGYPSETFRKAGVLSTGYADGCFDAVIARDVIDHMPIRQGMEAVKELLRIVRPGGCVLLTLDTTDSGYESEPHTANDEGDYLFHDGKWNGMVFHPYTVHDIEKLANGIAYTILSSDDHGFTVALEAKA